ncbi:MULTISPECIES: tape measure protein [Clostridium]|uniref:tape measure protein n=2 Tax=Clostridiaceae TaxID=31979 RepID=UPI0006C020C3|nr:MULTISPECIES: tape measure protein [Clostridium]CUN95932.1 phage-like protein [Clostridium disporicum]
MSDVFRLSSSIELDINDVMSGLQQVDRQSEETRDSLENIEDSADSASGRFSGLGKMAQSGLKVVDKWAKIGATAVAGLASGMIALGIKSNASLETSQVAWTTLLGTQEEAKQMLDDITKYAATTPFSKTGVDAMAKQLHNAGYEGQNLFDQLTKFGNMGSAFGVQEDSLKEMVRQYSQVQMAGTAYTEDLNIIQDRGIPIYKALSETLNVSVADVKNMASEGKITAEVYNKALDSIASGTNGAMEAQSKTFSGMLSTIQDNVVNISQKIIQPIFEKVLEYMPMIIELADNFSANLDEGKGVLDSLKEAITTVFGEDTWNKITMATTVVMGLVGAYAILKGVMFMSDLINSVSSAWGVLSSAMGIGTAVTEGATVAQTGLNLAWLASPITWIIAGIVAVIAIFVLLWNKCEGFRNFWIGLWDKVVSSFKSAKDSVVNGVSDMTSKAVNKFNEIKQGITDKINGAKDAVKSAIDKIKGFFNFDWSLPKIKLPHFNISGKFSLNPPSIPTFGVDWYSSGGIFTKPTIIGNIGVGDADNGKGRQAEAVLPLKPFYQEMESMFIKYSSRPLYLDVDGKSFLRATAKNKDVWDSYDYRNPRLTYK